MGTHLNYKFLRSFTPTKLSNQKESFEAEIQLKHTCNGVVYTITQETITKYETLANDPLLKEVWTQAMCKELGCLAQGWGGKEGTDTVFFMTPEEIVVDYRQQKDDPNHVRTLIITIPSKSKHTFTTKKSKLPPGITKYKPILHQFCMICTFVHDISFHCLNSLLP